MKDMEEIFSFSFVYEGKESLDNHFYYADYWVEK